jgi:hypothetical protein
VSFFFGVLILMSVFAQNVTWLNFVGVFGSLRLDIYCSRKSAQKIGKSAIFGKDHCEKSATNCAKKA